MNVERLAKEYLSRKKFLDDTARTVEELKALLNKAVESEGTPDEKGHVWLAAGDFLLQRQKRQGKSYLDRAAAEEWAKAKGIWDEVKVVKEELNEDALLGYAFEHRKDPGLEDEFEALYVEPAPTWAFIAPIEQKQYEY